MTESLTLYGSLTSPFVRAVRIAAQELDLPVTFEDTVVKPTQVNRAYGDAVNPLRRVPALRTETGEVIVDSRVILEYLNAKAGGALIPADPAARVARLNLHAVVAGATEALVLAMYESVLRPEERRWPEWIDDQINKAETTFDWVEARVDDYAAAFDVAGIGLVCLVGYADLRFPDRNWLADRPRLTAYMDSVADRSSVADTQPPKA